MHSPMHVLHVVIIEMLFKLHNNGLIIPQLLCTCILRHNYIREYMNSREKYAWVFIKLVKKETLTSLDDDNSLMAEMKKKVRPSTSPWPGLIILSFWL